MENLNITLSHTQWRYGTGRASKNPKTQNTMVLCIRIPAFAFAEIADFPACIYCILL